jgi:acyl carrier protein
MISPFQEPIIMGLDSVELVMRIEEAFKIEIHDRDAEKIQTVGDLCDYVLIRLDVCGETASRCLSALAFFRFRRELISCFRIPRRAVRPESPLNSLIPAINRRAEWRRLEKSLGWELPGLLRPDWVGATAFGLILVCPSIALLASYFSANAAPQAMLSWLFTSVVLAAFLIIVLYKLTEPLADRFATQTLRGLVPMMLAGNLAAIEDPGVRWTRRDVRETVIAIVVEQVGVSPDSITDSTSFVNDLGLD